MAQLLGGKTKEDLHQVLHDWQTGIHYKRLSYGLEPTKNFPGGLTPENADIYYAVTPRPAEFAKLYAQHGRNAQRQTLIAYQLAAADAHAASEAAYRANKAVMAALRSPGPTFPVVSRPPYQGEPWAVQTEEDRTTYGWMEGKKDEGFEFQRLEHWLATYPEPPDLPPMKTVKCGEPSPPKLDPVDHDRPGEKQPASRVSPASGNRGYEEENGTLADDSLGYVVKPPKEAAEGKAGKPGEKNKETKCNPMTPMHCDTGLCFCECQERRDEFDAYGVDYGNDPQKAASALPFNPPEPINFFADSGPLGLVLAVGFSSIWKTVQERQQSQRRSMTAKRRRHAEFV